MAAPGAPENLAAIPDVYEMTLAWDEPADDGGGIADYIIIYQESGLSEDPNEWITWMGDGFNDATSAVVSFLDPDTAYDFGVMAENEDEEIGPVAFVTEFTLPAPNYLIPPPGYTDISFGARVNELAGTVGETPTTAANILAGTTGESLTTALNIAAGTTGESAAAALNIMAGTTGEPAAEAARKIVSFYGDVG